MPQFMSSANLSLKQSIPSIPSVKGEYDTNHIHEKSSSSLQLANEIEIIDVAMIKNYPACRKNSMNHAYINITESPINIDSTAVSSTKSPVHHHHSRKNEYINDNTSIISVQGTPQRPPRNRYNQFTLSKSTTCISLDASPIFTNNSTIKTTIPYRNNGYPNKAFDNGQLMSQDRIDDNNSETTLSTITRHCKAQEAFQNGYIPYIESKGVPYLSNPSHNNAYKWPTVFHNSTQNPGIINSPYLYSLNEPFVHQDKLFNGYFPTTKDYPLNSQFPMMKEHKLEGISGSGYGFPQSILPYQLPKGSLYSPSNHDNNSMKFNGEELDRVNMFLLNQPSLAVENEELRKKLEEANSRLEYLEALEMHVNYLEVLFEEIVASQHRQNSIHNQLHSVSMPSIIAHLPATPKRFNRSRRFVNHPNLNSPVSNNNANDINNSPPSAIIPLNNMTNISSNTTTGVSTTKSSTSDCKPERRKFPEQNEDACSNDTQNNNTSKNSSRTVSLDRYHGTDSSKVPSSFSYGQEFPKYSPISQLDKEHSFIKAESSSEVHDLQKDSDKDNKIDFYLHSSTETGYEDVVDDDVMNKPDKSSSSQLENDESSAINNNSSTTSTTNESKGLNNGDHSNSTISSVNTIVRNYPSPGNIMKTGVSSVTPGCARRVRLMMKQKTSKEIDFPDENCTIDRKSSPKMEVTMNLGEHEFEYCKEEELDEEINSLDCQTNQNGSGSYEGVNSLISSNNSMVASKYLNVSSTNSSSQEAELNQGSTMKSKANSLILIDKFKNVIYRNNNSTTSVIPNCLNSYNSPLTIKEFDSRRKNLQFNNNNNNPLINKVNFSTPPTPRKSYQGRNFKTDCDEPTIGFRSPPLGVGSRHNSFASDRPRLQTLQLINSKKVKTQSSSQMELSKSKNNSNILTPETARKTFGNKF